MRPTARDPQSLALPVVERGLQESRDREKRDLRVSERTHLASISAKPGTSGGRTPEPAASLARGRSSSRAEAGEPRPRRSAPHPRLRTGWIFLAVPAIQFRRAGSTESLRGPMARGIGSVAGAKFREVAARQPGWQIVFILLTSKPVSRCLEWHSQILDKPTLIFYACH